MPISSMRLWAIAITALLALSVRDETRWQSAVLSIGFGHYLLSLWYARRKLATVASDWSTAAPMLAAIAVGAVLYATRFSLVIYFAVHHVCNEVYINAHVVKPMTHRQRTLYSATAIALQTLLYFYVLRNELPIPLYHPEILLAALAVAYVVYCNLLVRLRKSLPPRHLLELSAFELVGLFVLAASFVVPIRFLDVVCYHFVFWWFYPASKLAEKGLAAVYEYMFAMAALVGVSFLLSPAGLIGDYPFRDSIYLQQFILWSHIHITSSFFLSAAHPAWIRRWFSRPQPAATTASPAAFSAPPAGIKR